MELACILSLQQSQGQQQARQEKSTEQKDDKPQAPEKSKKDAAKSSDATSEEASHVSDIQRVTKYFANISLVGSYSCEGAESSESAGGKQTDAAHRAMSYLEKVGHLRAELRALLSRGMRGKKI